MTNRKKKEKAMDHEYLSRNRAHVLRLLEIKLVEVHELMMEERFTAAAVKLERAMSLLYSRQNWLGRKSIDLNDHDE